MRDGLALVEQSLLEADVSYSVAKDFIARVTEKALGEKVLLALNPTQQLVGIIHQELINMLGPGRSVASAPQGRDRPDDVRLAGLGQNDHLRQARQAAAAEQEDMPLLVAADLQRPAAIEQLHVIGQQLDVPVYSEPGAQDPVDGLPATPSRRRKAEQMPTSSCSTRPAGWRSTKS